MSSKKITVYSSIDEQKEKEYELTRQQSGIDRLREAVILIRQVYKLQLDNYVRSNRISFQSKQQ